MIGQLAAVGLGGCLGAMARYALGGAIQRRFPTYPQSGTLLVNVVGCLFIGMLMELILRGRLSETGNWRLFLITGLLGSLTTFSTFGYETVELLREQRLRLAIGNVVGNVVLGCAAVAAGIAAVQAWWK